MKVDVKHFHETGKVANDPLSENLFRLGAFPVGGFGATMYSPQKVAARKFARAEEQRQLDKLPKMRRPK